MFDVVFLSQMQEGVSHGQACARLQRAFNLDERQLKRLLSKKRYVIRKKVDANLAARLKEVILRCGFYCELVEDFSLQVDQKSPSLYFSEDNYFAEKSRNAGEKGKSRYARTG